MATRTSKRPELADRDVQPSLFDPPEQIALCTRDEGCKADVADHYDDCPVEAELRKVFGF